MGNIIVVFVNSAVNWPPTVIPTDVPYAISQYNTRYEEMLSQW